MWKISRQVSGRRGVFRTVISIVISIDDRIAGSIAWHPMSCISLFFSIFIPGNGAVPSPCIGGIVGCLELGKDPFLHARARYLLSDRSYVSFMDGYMTRTSVTDCKLLFPVPGKNGSSSPGIDPYMSCNASTPGNVATRRPIRAGISSFCTGIPSRRWAQGVVKGALSRAGFSGTRVFSSPFRRKDKRPYPFWFSLTTSFIFSTKVRIPSL